MSWCDVAMGAGLTALVVGIGGGWLAVVGGWPK